MAVQISRVLHACYVFESEGTRLLFDPLFENPFSRNCHAFPSVDFDRSEISRQTFSAVIISHHHDDHCSLESLDLLDRNTPIYMYCLHEEMFEILRAMDFHTVLPLAINKPVTIGSFTVTPRRAFDKDVDCLIQIQTRDLNMLNVVDAWIDDDTLESLAAHTPWDLIAWPFQTLREIDVLSPTRALPATTTTPHEWLRQLERLNPRIVVPSSCQFKMEPWSWYNDFFFPLSYGQFERDVKELLPQSHVWRLDPSQSLTLTPLGATSASAFKGVTLLDQSLPDYCFNPQKGAASTASIAANLPHLEPTHLERTLHFLENEILGKWSVVSPEPPDYFSTPRNWHLTVWDKKGQGFDFFYELKPHQMERLPHAPEVIQWRTEIPLYTLYRALEEGDSLTSLYIRINDLRFGDAVEKELENTDLIVDPLLRCLYNDNFASYQKAQFQRIFRRAYL